MKNQSFINNLEKLDNWSNETIKNSSLCKSIIFITNPISNLFKYNNTLPVLLIVSISAIFTSLSMPQFANDRFGIGLVILVCFFIFLLYLFSNKSLKITFNSIDLCIILFLILATISTFSSYFFKESLTGLLKYITFFLWYFIVKTIVVNFSQKTFLNLWSFLCLCGIVTALIGICQYIIGVEPLATWEDPTQETIHIRVYSTLGNPNLLAGYLLLVLPVCIALVFEQKNKLFKIIFLAGVALVLICLILTGSRGGYIGLIFSFVMSLVIFLNHFTFQKKANNKLTVTLTVFGIIAFILSLTFLFPVITERILTIFTFREHSSNNYRLNVWAACLKMLKDNLLIGIGPGNNTFRLAYGLYMITGFDALAAYNIFLEIAIEIGLLGCFIFIFIFLLSFLKLHWLFWQKGSIFSFGIFISLIGLLTHGMVDTVFFRPQIFIPFWFLLASIGRIEHESGTKG
ncbi:MAG: hypothetical protein A3I68_07780 [Candidatus Melainabacteria bacterium RIFCSPLOWO2_02_FULL_35_15]|nr:MAG: hypothetical protein A3F80_02750 [Candidatus Melainabacteria bacterium RIFCSPLOWO2_12_FULL_35_11]OGI14190.1 MAG: hypothetical protein A3I68_07780 [Candidatus Melainabacteria bacterium RIFCSPLOWO2_02_FULL_35_15]